MKSVLLYSSIILFFSTLAHAHCDQRIYDHMYREVVKIQLQANLTNLVRVNESSFRQQEHLLEENAVPNFKIFRDLCFGQKTSYEVPNENK